METQVSFLSYLWIPVIVAGFCLPVIGISFAAHRLYGWLTKKLT